MSKVITTELQHSGASSANITLASDGSVALPNDTVDIATLSATGTASSSTFLRGDNSWAAAGGGKINQIVMYTDSTNRDLSTANAWTQIPSMEVAITTTDNNSKVMVMHHGNHFQDTADLTAGMTIYRDSTNLGSAEYGFTWFYGSANDFSHPVSMHYLDTPGNAGTYTYKIYYKSDKTDGHYNQWTGRVVTSVTTAWEVLP